MTWKWLYRRFVFALIVLLIALTINFILPRLMPISVVDFYTQGSKLNEEARQALIHRFGLDKPVTTQFFLYVINAFRGNFGVSFSYYPTPVSTLIWKFLPWSLFILLTSLVLQVLIGYFLGVIAAWRAGSKTDSAIQAISLSVWSTPLFWMGMIFLWVFGFILHWFPLSGNLTPGAEYANPFQFLGDALKHAFLPILVQTLNWFGSYELVMRNTMTITLKEHYIMAAEAKGLSDNEVKYKHAARNALLPLVTITGIRFSMAVAGSIFVEAVFSYPGIGQLIFNSVNSHDYPTLQGAFFIFSVVVILVNFLVDILYMRLDPRVRFK